MHPSSVPTDNSPISSTGWKTSRSLFSKKRKGICRKRSPKSCGMHGNRPCRARPPGRLRLRIPGGGTADRLCRRCGADGEMPGRSGEGSEDSPQSPVQRHQIHAAGRQDRPDPAHGRRPGGHRHIGQRTRHSGPPPGADFRTILAGRNHRPWPPGRHRARPGHRQGIRPAARRHHCGRRCARRRGAVPRHPAPCRTRRARRSRHP